MVCRIEKTKNYTVMSNHHLTNGRLSLKAKGLLSLMLSLPEEWDYTIKGLATICKEGVDSIGTAIKELEEENYITRHRIRDERGRLLGTEYIIHEVPAEAETLENMDFLPKRENPVLDKNTNNEDDCVNENTPKRENPVLDKSPKRDFPRLDNPRQEKPEQEKPVQSNTNILNTNINKILNNKNNSIHLSQGAVMDRMDREEVSIRLKQQIDYDILMSDAEYSDWVNEIYELMLDVMTSNQKEYKVNGTFESADKIKSRMLSLRSEHIMFVLHSIKNAAGDIRNIRSYLLTSLYNSPLTYQTSVNAGLNQSKYCS